MPTVLLQLTSNGGTNATLKCKVAEQMQLRALQLVQIWYILLSKLRKLTLHLLRKARGDFLHIKYSLYSNKVVCLFVLLPRQHPLSSLAKLRAISQLIAIVCFRKENIYCLYDIIFCPKSKYKTKRS